MIPLWEHPLGEVFGTGDGKRAVMLTMLDRRLGPQAEHLAACRERVAEVTRAQTAEGGDDWSRLTRVVDVRRAGDGRIVVTTPLFEALSLRDTLGAGRLSLARVFAIARQLCHALRPLHRAGLHHGALSSASVLLVTDKGREDAVRVVDLGVAALFTAPTECDGPSEEQPLTPEHADGALTTRSDIYRMGVLMHTMLTGKTPFPGDTAAAVMRAHLEWAPAKLTGVASVLAEIVSRCLAKEPIGRFESIDALEVALCQAQADAAITTAWDDLPRPTCAPPPPPAGRTSSARVTNATPDDADAVEPVEAETEESNEATTEYQRGDRAATASRRSTPRPTTSRRVPIYLGGAALGVLLLGWFALRSGGSRSETSAAHEQPTALGSVAVADEAPTPTRAESSDDPSSGSDKPTKGDPVPVPAEIDEPEPIRAAALNEPPGEAYEPEPAAPTQTAAELVAEAKRARSQGKTNEAISLFRRALATDGKNLHALEGLGLIYFNQAEYKKAVAQLERAVAIAPNNVEYRTLLGDAFFKLERYKKARTHYAKAAQRGHPPAKSRLEKVQKKLDG